MGIIIAILIFSLIVTVHEFGHFICAKLSGINVLEFSVGMGPKLLQKQYHGTKYSLRVIPMGGYCAMEDEDASGDNPHGFRNAKLWKRMIVLVAGPLMNFVLGFILIVGMVLSMKTIPTTTVKGFFGSKSDDGTITYYSQSHETGLEHDDRIISVDGTSIFSYLDLSYIFATTKTHTHDVVVERDGKRVELPEVVFNDKRDGDMVDFALYHKDKSALNVTKASGGIFLSMGHVVTLSFKQLVTGKVDKAEVSGPVGVVSTISEATEKSEDKADAFLQLFYISALISVNVGIFNLLPIPGLDGIQIIFIAVEMVIGRKLSEKAEARLTVVGFVIIVLLLILAFVSDILRIIFGY